MLTLTSDSRLHIGIHPVPANDTKGDPEHWHIDFRYLFHTGAEVGPLPTEEVTDAAWREIDSISEDRLRRRIGRAHR
ncbi:hypothetical protein [Streptomyces sp. NPDC088725]|uniref:hypothetical protein n=1 Tax=Streptomyces sp. NPDC088725 TaxID=3365873 RepID=UPI003812F2C1